MVLPVKKNAAKTSRRRFKSPVASRLRNTAGRLENMRSAGSTTVGPPHTENKAVARYPLHAVASQLHVDQLPRLDQDGLGFAGMIRLQAAHRNAGEPAKSRVLAEPRHDADPYADQRLILADHAVH